MMSAEDIILKPIITERTMDQMEYNRYTFKVSKRANKTEVKKAIEKLFDVKVKKVNIMNVFGKNKRVGQFLGRRSDWKKAIVTLTEDSKAIEYFEGM